MHVSSQCLPHGWALHARTGQIWCDDCAAVGIPDRKLRPCNSGNSHRQPARRKQRPIIQQLQRLNQLNSESRLRELSDDESVELEGLLHADYCRRLRMGQPIPRGVA